MKISYFCAYHYRVIAANLRAQIETLMIVATQVMQDQANNIRGLIARCLCSIDDVINSDTARIYNVQKE